MIPIALLEPAVLRNPNKAILAMRERRRALGLSQRKLAAAALIRGGTIGDWERLALRGKAKTPRRLQWASVMAVLDLAESQVSR